MYALFPHIKEEVEIERQKLIQSSNSSENANHTANTHKSHTTTSSANLWNEETVYITKQYIMSNLICQFVQEILSWEPALVLSSRLIDMNQLTLKIDDSSLAWLYNLLASVFAGVIKEYVCASLKDLLGAQSAELLGTVNNTVCDYWPLMYRMFKVHTALNQ